MNRLKGNYKVPKGSQDNDQKKPEKQSSSQEFERRALEKLGGSIAFVHKKDSFIWNGDPSDPKSKK